MTSTIPKPEPATHTTTKSTWWSITAYGENIERCEGALPEWVKAIYGGREECPKTKRIHFQGAIQCHDQVRMSKFRTWVPGAHLEPARSADALREYAMKADTAVGEKIKRENPTKFYKAHEICKMIADTATRRDLWGIQPVSQTKEQHYKRVYGDAIQHILLMAPSLAGQFMNPSLRNFFAITADTWRNVILGESDSITLSPALGVHECPICNLTHDLAEYCPQP